MAVSTQREGPVSVIWLDRPEKLNAFDRAQGIGISSCVFRTTDSRAI